MVAVVPPQPPNLTLPVAAPPEPPPKLTPPPNEPMIPEDGPPILLLVGLGVSLAGLAVSHWGLRSVIDEIWTKPKRWFKKLITWPARKLVVPQRQLEARLMGEFSSRLAMAAPHVAQWFHQEAVVTEKLSGVIVSSNQATYKALYKLRHIVVPTLIQRAIVPIYAQLRTHANVLNDLDNRFDQAGLKIDRALQQLPWGSPAGFQSELQAWLNSYVHLWNQFFDVAQPRLNTLWNNRVVDLQDRFNALETQVTTIREQALPSIRQRLGRIEDFLGGLATDPTTWVFGLIGAAMIPALSSGGMRTALGNLTCKNTQTVARELCASPVNWLDDILAGAVGLLFLADMCDMLDLMFSLAGFVGDGIAVINSEVSGKSTVCGSDKAPELFGYVA